MVVVGQRQQPGADERPVGEVERPPQLLGGDPAGLGLAIGVGEVAEVGRFERRRQRPRAVG